jgi:hypothetical protein
MPMVRCCKDHRQVADCRTIEVLALIVDLAAPSRPSEARPPAVIRPFTAETYLSI